MLKVKFIIFFVVLLVLNFCYPSFAIDECDPNKTLLSKEYKVILDSVDDGNSDPAFQVSRQVGYQIKVIKSMAYRGDGSSGKYVQFFTKTRDMLALKRLSREVFTGVITLVCNNTNNTKEVYFDLPIYYYLGPSNSPESLANGFGLLYPDYRRCKGELVDRKINGVCETPITTPSFFTETTSFSSNATHVEKFNFSAEPIN